MNKIPDPHTFTAPQTATPQKKKPTPKEREEKKLQRGVSALELIIGITVAALALLSGYWTFEGTVLYFERSIGLTFKSMIISALLAIAVTLAIVVLWWAILFVIPRSRTVKGILLGLAIALTVQGWTLAVSSVFNAINLTSGTAIISTLDDKKGEYTIAVSATLERALKLKESLPGLKGSAKSWCTKAESEKSSGGITGSAGKGAVSGELDGICGFVRIPTPSGR